MEGPQPLYGRLSYPAVMVIWFGLSFVGTVVVRDEGSGGHVRGAVGALLDGLRVSAGGDRLHRRLCLWCTLNLPMGHYNLARTLTCTLL